MKIAAVLLRWYKSFNVNYVGYRLDRRQGVTSRPWNLLARATDSENDYPFIEIPLEDDITTIVGANESGKSHLLSAISKVLTGKGIPDDFSEGRSYSRTDLCHYMSQRSKNAEDWPHIGLQFKSLTASDMQTGDVIKQRITGKARKCKKLIDEGFVLQMGSLIPSAPEHKTVTTEDLIPVKLYAKAVERFVDKWHPDITPEKRQGLIDGLGKATLGSNGLVAATRDLFNAHVHSTPRDEYDKYGVLLEVVGVVQDAPKDDADVGRLKERVFSLCEGVRRAVSASQQASRRLSGKQAIVRLIDEFFVGHKESSSVFDVQLLFDRIQRDVVLLGEDGEPLDAAIKRMLAELTRLRSAGHHQLKDADWNVWKNVIEEIRKNPLGFRVQIKEGKPVVAPPVQEMSDGAAAVPPAELVGTMASTESNANVKQADQATVEPKKVGL